jgi:thiamine biosynthesis lipoprotein ApbE
VDPRTGLGLTARRAVSVVSIAGDFADALATAACVLGPEHSGPVLGLYPRTAAVFDEVTPEGPRRTVIDPEHVLRWAEAPQTAAHGD